MKDSPRLVPIQSEGKKDAAYEMRERLYEYRSMNEEIDSQIERLERLEAKLIGVGSPVLSDMPKASNTVYDRLTDNIAKKDELERDIKELIAERDSERRELESIIRRLRKSGEKAVIRMRYIDAEDWNDILDMLFGSKDDFEEKYDNYKQRMFRLHSAAISNMAALIM